MKIAIYTLTRDRLLYTQRCFESLRQNAGMPFDHYVLDNGSEDGTKEWLHEEQEKGRIHWLSSRVENIGISAASNMCLYEITGVDPSLWKHHRPDPGYSLIIKADNDAFVRTPNILPQICEVARAAGEGWILSPRVSGLNKQPRRSQTIEIAGHPVGVTPIVGGLFHVVPAAVYRRYMDAGGYPEELPLAKFQDDRFCHWFRTTQRGQCGYIEDLEVEHYETTDGQAKRFPEYFQRKWNEEKGEMFPK